MTGRRLVAASESAPVGADPSQARAAGAVSEAEPFVYEVEVNKLLLAVRFLANVDVKGIREAISYADAVGWAVDPTMYRDALEKGDMHAIQRLAGALEPVLKVWREDIAPKIPDPYA